MAENSNIVETNHRSNHSLKCEENSAVPGEKFMLDRILKCPGFGLLCCVLSTFIFATTSLFVKLMYNIHPVQLTLARTYVQFIILLPWLFRKRNEIDILGPYGLRRFLYFRGIVGSSALVFWYQALNALSIGNAVTITYLNLAMVPFIARVFLKETLSVFDLIFALIALVGVVFIAQPSFLFPLPEGEVTASSLIGVLFALVTAVLQATSMVTIRKLGKETPAPLSVLYYSFCGSVISTIVLGAMGEFRWPCRSDLPMFFSLGVLGVFGQYFLTLALQLERAGTVSVLRSCQIILVYIIQVTVFDDIPNKLSLIGAGLVFSSSIGIGARKLVNEGKRRMSVVKK